MNQKIVPDTDKVEVAKIAVAWEIIEKAYHNQSVFSPDDYARDVVNSFIKVYEALLTQTPIEPEPKK